MKTNSLWNKWGFYTSVIILLLLSACEDECEQVQTYTSYEPILASKEDVRTFDYQAARPLSKLGKIYFYKNYILINESQEGIHLIDNSDPANPRNTGFMHIPGNIDMAVYKDVLYADNYMDLLSIDLTDLSRPQLLHRSEEMFSSVQTDWNNPEMIIVGYNEIEVTETFPCGGGPLVEPMPRPGFGLWNRAEAFSMSNGAPSSGGAGVGGSMARFTISKGHLYTVESDNMQLFDLRNPTRPQQTGSVGLRPGIETIFPYRDHLFLGANTGMHIYDVTDPTNPTYVSSYEHVMACDPVVVEGSKAYVTLRTGNLCQQGVNALEVIDLSNMSSPRLLESYPMQNPHGLGVDNGRLFVCEGDYGLKVFNAVDPMLIDKRMLHHFDSFNAYDVIPLGGNLLLVGDDGLYQYDYTAFPEMKLLSHLPTVPSVK